MADTPDSNANGESDYLSPRKPSLNFNLASTDASAVNTPDSASLANTPSGISTPDLSDGDQTIATSTVTTTITRSGKDYVTHAPSTTQFTHVGAKGLSHRIDKDGAIHLRPTPSTSSRKKKIRTIVSFRPRHSHFDRHNTSSSGDQFRGFYTLFWISITLFVLNTFYTSFSDTGQVLSLTFATLFSRDAGMLALSDGILIGSLFLCVPFAKVCKRGWVRYWPTAVVFQHLWQATLLGLVIKWARYREWPWVQSGFFALHTLCMMMKIHSYMTVNGNMADTYHRIRRIESMIEERVTEVEGAAAGRGEEQLEASWIKAVNRARAHARSNDEAHAGGPAEAEHVDGKDEKVTKKARSASRHQDWFKLEMQRGSKLERVRRARVGLVDKEKQDAEASSARQRTASDAAKDHMVVRDPHPLATHPDSIIAGLARDIELLREELLTTTTSATTDPGMYKEETVMWPHNITYANFWDYLLVPTLVYELSYPRTASIRPLYVLEKTLATFGTFFVIYVITEHWIMPYTPTPETPLLRTFLQLAVPMMLNYLLLFYLIFEAVCNGFAELTRFADREFYQDWWNATSMDIFSRKWNKPVHSFLLRHVYASTIAAWGLSKNMAMFLTFLLSSLVHELVMAIVSGKIRFYLFAAQMIQLPLMLVSQIPFIKQNETLGNMIFWIGLMSGFPLLNIGYLVY